MKLLFLLLIAFIVAGFVFFFSAVANNKTKKNKRHKWKKPLAIAGTVYIVLLGLIVWGTYSSEHQRDLQCTSIHSTTTQPPSALKTAQDYFLQGNYDYDTGNCTKAIEDYTNAIGLNPSYAQAYNNRAYTNMRMRKYSDALPDLDKAIQLNPNYIQALMNRGDIRNYYYQIDRKAAVADYEKVMELTDSSTRQQTSVCGHLFLAEHNGWTLGAYLDYFTGAWTACK